MPSCEVGIGNGHLRWRLKPFKKLYFWIGKKLGAAWVDTAQQYGSGESEVSISLYANSFPVVTKVGLWKDQRAEDESRWDRDYNAISFLTKLEKSFTRLSKSHIEIVLLHCPSSNLDHYPQVSILRKLKFSGRIRHIGFSADNESQIPLGFQSWATVVEAPLHILEKLNAKQISTMVINGIFRFKVSFSQLEAFVMRNPNVDFIFLSGSTSFIRFAFSQFRLRKLANKLNGLRKSEASE